jgi:hypothetical protein
MPTIVAMAYKYSIGEPFMSPRHDLGYAANFLYMMFATPREAFRPNPVLVRALDRLLIVHAEYGQDASTSTVRMAGSSGANPFACVSAAIASLSGPAHGGASEACLAQLAAIGDVSRVAQFVARARDESDSFRLTGFGPSVYSSFDPRAKLLREVCDEILPELRLEDHRLFKVARALEKVALEDPYFVEHKLYPNVDFYSGYPAEGTRHSTLDVRLHPRPRPHAWLDGTLGRNAGRCGIQDRPPAPALHRCEQASPDGVVAFQKRLKNRYCRMRRRSRSRLVSERSGQQAASRVIAAPTRGGPTRRRRRSAYLKTIVSTRSGISGKAPTRGDCPRNTELPSNRVRWSMGAGASQCDSSIWPLCP